MSLILRVDGDRWRTHLKDVVQRHPGLVPVAKGNGYGFGLPRLARKAEWLGVDTLAVGTYEEVAEVEQRYDGSILVMTPWRPFGVTLETDPATRQTFQIMGFKCEYVDGLERELNLHNNRCTELNASLTAVYRRAERAGQMRKGLKPAPAALATCSFLVGLVRLWLMDRTGKQVRNKAKSIVKAHVDSLRRL